MLIPKLSKIKTTTLKCLPGALEVAEKGIHITPQAGVESKVLADACAIVAMRQALQTPCKFVKTIGFCLDSKSVVETAQVLASTNHLTHLFGFDTHYGEIAADSNPSHNNGDQNAHEYSRVMRLLMGEPVPAQADSEDMHAEQVVAQACYHAGGTPGVTCPHCVREKHEASQSHPLDKALLEARQELADDRSNIARKKPDTAKQSMKDGRLQKAMTVVNGAKLNLFGGSMYITDGEKFRDAVRHVLHSTLLIGGAPRIFLEAVWQKYYKAEGHITFSSFLEKLQALGDKANDITDRGQNAGDQNINAEIVHLNRSSEYGPLIVSYYDEDSDLRVYDGQGRFDDYIEPSAVSRFAHSVMIPGSNKEQGEGRKGSSCHISGDPRILANSDLYHTAMDHWHDDKYQEWIRQLNKEGLSESGAELIGQLKAVSNKAVDCLPHTVGQVVGGVRRFPFQIGEAVKIEGQSHLGLGLLIWYNATEVEPAKVWFPKTDCEYHFSEDQLLHLLPLQ